MNKIVAPFLTTTRFWSLDQPTFVQHVYQSFINIDMSWSGPKLSQMPVTKLTTRCELQVYLGATFIDLGDQAFSVLWPINYWKQSNLYHKYRSKRHIIIQSHDNVLRDCQYSIKKSSHSDWIWTIHVNTLTNSNEEHQSCFMSFLGTQFIILENIVWRYIIIEY